MLSLIHILINMRYMFYNCSSLTSLDLSNFDTNEVIAMNHMFYNCKALIQLDLSNFYTSKVTDMSYMFSSCERLTSLDLSNFDTNKVTAMNNICLLYTSTKGLSCYYVFIFFSSFLKEI